MNTHQTNFPNGAQPGTLMFKLERGTGKNGCITQKELQNIYEQHPNQIIHIITGLYPNRERRRAVWASMRPVQPSNRKLTSGRKVERLATTGIALPSRVYRFLSAIKKKLLASKAGTLK